MKTINKIRSYAVFFTLILVSLSSFSQPENTLDRCLSPYFLVQGNDETTNFPLLETNANVTISGVIASVEVTQKYQNKGEAPIEAIYVFPASTNAAVHAMEMQIGERTITAVIKEKQQARQDYENALQDGKTASLLEQKRPNVFQMNVGNILPGEIIDVTLKYTELIIPKNGTYEFVYPTVVGPRYSEEMPDGDNNWIANPYTGEGEKPLYQFDIEATVNSAIPLKDVKVTTHETNVNFINANKAEIKLIPTASFSGNKDFILKYRLQGEKIETGIMLYEGEEENFFVGMIEPPMQVTENDIPSREYIFIIDVSGSMNGFPLNISKSLMTEIFEDLRATDKFNIITFAGASEVLSDQSLFASEANKNKALQFINAQHGGGGTNLLPALQRALTMNNENNYSRTFVMLTDGYVTVEKEAFDLIRNNLQAANFFSFGIGSSVNRFIIEGMAHVGRTAPIVVTKQAEAETAAKEFVNMIKSPVLTNIQINFKGFESYDVEPISPPDVFANSPVVFFGKYRGTPTGKVSITGLTGSNTFETTIDISKKIRSGQHEALKFLWARERIKILNDYSQVSQDDKIKKEVTELGLKYNLLTAYTSFVAIDSEVRTDGSKTETIVQPLPLPEGVSNQAVGSYMTTASIARQTVARGHKKAESERAYYQTMEEADLEIEANEVFVLAENSAEYPDGLDAFKTFIEKELKNQGAIPSELLGQRVILKFTIDKNGYPRDPELVNVKNEALIEAIKSIFIKSVKWQPAMQNGKAVKTELTIRLQL